MGSATGAWGAELATTAVGTPRCAPKRVLAALSLAFVACGGTNPTSPIAQPSASAQVGTTVTASPPPVLALVGGRLVDGNGGEPLEDATLILRDGLVTAVGPRGSLPIPEGALVIDVAGATVLPGLVNAHVHNAFEPRNLSAWAADGVTTVRDVGARETPQAAFAVRDASRSDPSRARIVAAGPLVTVQGGYPLVPNGFPALVVNGADDARERVRQLLDQGADLVKVTLEPGGGRLPVMSAAELRAIVETAHSRSVPVSAHVTTAHYLEMALEAGVDDAAHMPPDPLPDGLIARVAAAGMAVVPTLAAIGGGAGENLRRLVAAGGLVAMGNDGGYLAGLEVGLPLDELTRMERAGLTRMQVILAATRDAARVCRRAAVVGTIEPGKAADVLVVEGDPLSDLRDLARVRLVIHGGYVIRGTPSQAGPNAKASLLVHPRDRPADRQQGSAS
jgi:imidazolonepropionase-like amidohydrolase